MLPSSLPTLWLLCVSAVAATEFPPLPTSEPDLGTTTPLLHAEDESLLRVWEREPARVLEHIRAQQRRIGWLEHQLRKVVAKFDLDRGPQRSAVLSSRAQSGAKRAIRAHSQTSEQFGHSGRLPPAATRARQPQTATRSHAKAVR